MTNPNTTARRRIAIAATRRLAALAAAAVTLTLGPCAAAPAVALAFPNGPC